MMQITPPLNAKKEDLVKLMTTTYIQTLVMRMRDRGRIIPFHPVAWSVDTSETGETTRANIACLLVDALRNGTLMEVIDQVKGKGKGRGERERPTAISKLISRAKGQRQGHSQGKKTSLRPRPSNGQ
jgi:hypothetical protein